MSKQTGHEKEAAALDEFMQTLTKLAKLVDAPNIHNNYPAFLFGIGTH